VPSETVAIIVAAIGATTGAISLASQWWTNRFKLVFERADLRFEPEAVKQLSKRPPEALNQSFFEFEAEVELLNRASGRGSIEKPRLEIRFPDGTTSVVFPDTQERKSESIAGSPNAYRIWVERWGNSYSIAPRERLDDALSYMIEFEEGQRFWTFLQAFDDLTFTFLYRDHKGREQRRAISKLVGVEDLA
jgi:hypothetical protein